MKKILFTLLMLAVTSAALAENTFVPDSIVTYKTAPDSAGNPVDLKLHIFNPDGHTAADNSPAIVFFFGGGWKSGAPKQFYPHCEYLASRGMVAMSAEYRVSSRHGTSPRECVKDGKSAIRWIREHADELGIDPHRLAAGGGSAGGHVAAATGTLDGFNEDSDDESIRCRPDALVLFNPVFDNGPDGYGYGRVSEYWEDFSPMHNIGRDTPPTIVFLGTSDKLIPVSTADEYRNRMTQKRLRCDLFLYENQQHGFFNYANKEHFFLTLREADRFLQSLGFLEGEPTLKKME